MITEKRITHTHTHTHTHTLWGGSSSLPQSSVKLLRSTSQARLSICKKTNKCYRPVFLDPPTPSVPLCVRDVEASSIPNG